MQEKQLLLVLGVMLILFGLLAGLPFLGLSRLFNYPTILRRPTGEILEKYHAGGYRLTITWLLFTLAFLLFVPVVTLFYEVLNGLGDNLWFLGTGAAFGLIAALVNMLGLIRWVFLVPLLARAYADESTSMARREAIETVFEAFHTYAGVGVGEFLGYTCLALWGILIGGGIIETGLLHVDFGAVAIILSLGMLAGVLEFAGWKPAGAIAAITSTLLIVWCIVVGAVLVFF